MRSPSSPRLLRASSPLGLLAWLFAATSVALAHWGVPEPVRPERERMYRASRHGGNTGHFREQRGISTPHFCQTK